MYRALALSSRALALSVALLMFGLVGQAQATEATGSQNPQLTVWVSLQSDGEDPDRATAGDQVTAAYSVTNNGNSRKVVRITGVVVTPSGQRFTQTERRPLEAKETYSFSYTYAVDPAFEKGVYRLTIRATNPAGTSRATARIEFY
jgi:hypothetical protein